MPTPEERWTAAAHAMQAGVKFDQESGSNDGTPKHLRTGINSALSNLAGLAKLLIDKGVITHDEYIEAVAQAMEEEAERYRQLLSDKLGTNVTLA